MLINGFHFIPTVTSNHFPKPEALLVPPSSWDAGELLFPDSQPASKTDVCVFVIFFTLCGSFDFLSPRQPSRVKVVNEPVCFMVCSHPAWLPHCSAWPHLSSEADGDPEGPPPPPHSPGTSAGGRFSWFYLHEIAPRVLSPVCLHPWLKIVHWVLCGHWHQEALPLSLGSWQCWVLKAAWCELPRWTVKAVSREKLDCHSRCSLSTFDPGDFSSKPSMKVNVFSVSGVLSICLTFSKSILLPASWRDHYSFSIPVSPPQINVCTNITGSWQAEDN